MRPRVARVVVLPLMGIVGACSLFTDFGSFNDDAVADRRDASGDGASLDDGSTTTTGADASPKSDASLSDAGADACVGFRFCDSFDDRIAAKGAWDNLQVNAASVDLTTTAALSPPRALLFVMPAKSAGVDSDYSFLRLTRSLLADAVMRVEADMRVEVDKSAFGAGAYSVLLTFAYDDHYAGAIDALSSGLSMGIWNYPSGNGPGAQDVLFDDQTKSGQWFHVVIEVKFDSLDGHARIEVDGRVAVDKTYRTTLAKPSTFSLSLGAGSRDQTPLLKVSYDNVKVR